MTNQNRTRRKKINLVRGKSRKLVNGFVWFVGKCKGSKTFFVADYDDDNKTVMWSSKKADGISFKTERAVYRFIHKHLNDRTDIILVQAPPE